VARELFEVNVFAVIEVTRAFSPLLIASEGTIVNISSCAGVMPQPWHGYYNSTKAAVSILSKQLRIELAPFNIKVVNVNTGGVSTRFFGNLLQTPCLEPDSIYAPAKNIIEPFLDSQLAQSRSIPVDVFATTVVNNALKKNPKKTMWTGGEAFKVWAAATFGWDNIWVRFLLWYSNYR
jgi:1-acylglycerone phosphate reductase